MQDIQIMSHCVNDSTGEYTIKLAWTGSDGVREVRIGGDALELIERTFSHWDSPSWRVKSSSYYKED